MPPSKKQPNPDLKSKKIDDIVDEAVLKEKKRLYKQINEKEARNQRLQREQMKKRKILAIKGKVILGQDLSQSQRLQVPVDGDVRGGTIVFMKNCSSCHSLEFKLSKGQIGPPLGVIYNKTSGSNSEYLRYSKSMMDANFPWTKRNLYRFMENTKLLVQGTHCDLMKNPIKNQVERADLMEMFYQYTKEFEMNLKLREIKEKGYQHFQSEISVQKQQQKMVINRAKMEQIKHRTYKPTAAQQKPELNKTSQEQL